MRIVFTTILTLSILFAGPDADARGFERCYDFRIVKVDGLPTFWFDINDRGVGVGDVCLRADCSIENVFPLAGGIYLPRLDKTKSVSLYQYDVGVIFRSINNLGVILANGFSSSSPEVDNFLLRPNGRIDVLPKFIEQAVQEFPQDINDRGTIAGFAFTSDSRIIGFIAEGAEVEVVDLDQDTYLLDTNNWGAAVGFIVNADNTESGFYKRPGRDAIIVNAPGAASTNLTGINDWGVASGVIDIDGDGDFDQVVLFDGRNFKPLSFDADNFGLAKINNRGELAGGYTFRTDGIFTEGFIAEPRRCRK